MGSQNFRLMMVATLPLDEPIRRTRPKVGMPKYERPAWKNKSNKRLARAMRHGEES